MEYIKKYRVPVVIILAIILCMETGYQIYRKFFIPEFEIKDHVLVKYNGADQIVEVPEGVVVIGKFAFAQNETIEQVILPDGAKEITFCAFYECPNLEEIVFPEGMEHFAYKSLVDIPNIKRLYLQDGITGEMWLELELQLEEVRIPSTADTFFSYIFKKNLYRTGENQALKTLILPPNVDCEELEIILKWLTKKDKLIIYGYEGSGVESIAFDYQVAFESIGTLRTEDDFILADDILVEYIGEDSSVKIPEGVRIIGRKAFFGKEQVKEIIMSDSVEYLGDKVFAGTRIESIYLSRNLKNIGEGNLRWKNVKELRIPPQITYIGPTYLGYNSALEDIYLPKEIKYIHEDSFWETNPDMVIHASNSYVKKYAKKHGFKYIEEDWEEEYYKE